LILHFECCRTGLEYPIVSHDWSKWLKIGFSLIKAGKAVIDIGMGNPLGLLATGVTCVQEVYEAYKTNDDDEFNTYITQPFLTSAEQDVLINKLRDQGFFDIFAYDAQLGGWYLLNPEKDGRVPEGEANSVTKVWSKKGYGGIAGTAAEVGKDVALSYIANQKLDKLSVGEVILSDTNTISFPPKLGVVDNQTEVPAVAESKAETKSITPTQTLLPVSVSDFKLRNEHEYDQKVDAYEKRIQQLEEKVLEMQNSIESLQNGKSSKICIIS
jgi:hypothetical protein